MLPRIRLATVPRVLVCLACTAAGLLATPWTSGGAARQDADVRTLDVVARRFEFVPASIEAVLGERLRIVVRSGDGLHGFGIRRFNISREVPRGASVTIEFTPDVAGEFPILCTEYCGDGHETMQGTLVVKARDSAPQ